MGWAARANHERNGATRSLRRLAGTIATRAQFERILREAAHPDQVRALIEPMLDEDLPCCAEFALTDTAHATSCPTRAVVLTG